jgi:WD40 repeat protein
MNERKHLDKHIFISYARADNAFVAPLVIDLQKRGVHIWIDRNDLKPGTRNWEHALRDAIKTAQAVLLIASPAVTKSNYVPDELSLAEMYTRPIIPVWVNGDRWLEAVPIGWGAIQYIDARGEKYPQALNDILTNIETPVSFSINVKQQISVSNPYKGLLPFKENDADLFFGRELAVSQLLEALKLILQTNEGRFLAIVGASGSGKSSLAMAGLLPALYKGKFENSEKWTYFQPLLLGSQPFENLSNVLSGHFHNLSLTAIDEDLKNPNTRGLHRLTERLIKNNEYAVLYIDQFEELFTQTLEENIRRQFIDLLTTAVSEPDGRLIVILSLRADFFDRVLNYSELGKLIRKYFAVLPMSLVDVFNAVQKPAKLAGLSFEEGLIAQLVFEIRSEQNEVGALPLLQFTLDQLYQRRQANMLTWQAYNEMGGVHGAIAYQADEILTTFSSEELETTQQLFLQLVTLGEGVGDTRRRIRRSSVNVPQINQQNLEKILDSFSRSRLLIFDHDTETREPTIEIAHEAMLRHWKTLREWINSNRNALRIEQQLNQQTQQWLEQERDTSFLATGARLEQFEELKGNANLILQDDSRDYLQASSDERQREQLRRTALFATAVIAAIFFGILAVFALSESQRANVARNEADAESRVAVSRELSIRSLLDVPETDRRLLLSAAAFRIADTDAARNTLFTQLQDFSLLRRFLHGSATTIRAIAYSPDGRWIAGGGGDPRGYLWDAAEGSLSDALLETSAAVTTVAFSPDSTRLVTGEEDGVISVWSIPDGELVASVILETEVARIALSPDGMLIAAAEEMGTITILDSTSLEIRTKLSSEYPIYALAFSPDGETLASGGVDQVIRLWSVADPEAEPQIVQGHNNWISSLTYNADGTILASTDFDSNVLLWNVEADYALLRTLQGHQNIVRTASFSPNGRLLASGGDDARVIIWDLQSGQALSAIPFENAQKVWSVSFNPVVPSGEPILIGGDTPVVPLWHLSQQTLAQSVETLPQPARLLHFDETNGDLWAYGKTIYSQSTDPIIADLGWRWSFAEDTYTQKVTYTEVVDRGTTAFALLSDGTIWANGDGDGLVKFFDAVNGKSLDERLRIGEGGIYALAFSRDGGRLAVGDNTGQIYIFQRVDNQWQLLDLTLDQHVDRVLTLTFSDDGRYLASGSLDTTVILWEFVDNAVTGTVLTAHSEPVMILAFNPDSTLLASGGRDSMFALWNVQTRSLWQELKSHTNWVTSLAFSHDGQTLVSGSSDQTAILWSLREGTMNPIGEPLNLTESIASVSFSPDDNYLALGGEAGRVRVWDIAIEDWVRAACQIANRNLTAAEITNYLHGLDQPNLCQ